MICRIIIVALSLAQPFYAKESDELCDLDAAEEAIKALHDDLDDDDDGTISSTENNAFNNEYGISAGSISALIGDSDGKVSADEFLESWKKSAVYGWTTKDVTEWLKLPDLKLKRNAIEILSRQMTENKISGKCFPLISKSDELLKRMGVRQHLVRRKLMLKAMDAILFGPPVYDSTVKDFALAFFIVVASVSVVSVINLKRENAKVEARLAEEHDKIDKLDSRWREFNEGSAPNGDSDSQSTFQDFQDFIPFRDMKRQNEQLRKSLDEAHKELRGLQSGLGNFDNVQITSELRMLLRRCHDYEKRGLDFRKDDALKKQNETKESYKNLQRANSSILGSVRLIHSPTQLSTFDQSVRSAQHALETVTVWQKDFSQRWKDLDKMFRIHKVRDMTIRNSQNGPPYRSTSTDQTPEADMPAFRTSESRSVPDMQRSSRPKLPRQTSEAAVHSTNGTADKNHNGYQALPSVPSSSHINSIETTSMSSSNSHIKIKTGGNILPKTFKNFIRLSWRDKKKKSDTKASQSKK